MKSGLFILPFLALLFGAIGMAIGSAFPAVSWVKYAGWGTSAAIFGLWITLDFEGFKRAFLRKGAKYGASAGLVVIMGVASIVGLAYLTNRPSFNKKFDITKSQVNTLSDQSVKMMNNLKERNLRVSVTAFFSDKDQKQGFSDLLDKYKSVADVIDARFYNPKEDPAKAAEFNITSENNVVFKTTDQEARISTFSEEKITNALAKILKTGSKKVYFSKGHGEPQIRSQGADSFNLAVAELENNRFEVAEISLLEKSEVPADASLLIIAGPKYDFSAAETAAIEKYLKSGGALFVAIDAATHVPELSGLLAKAGIGLSDDILIVPPGDPRALVYGRTTAFVTKFDEFHAATRDFSRQRGTALFAPNSRSLTAIDSNPLTLKTTLVAKTGGDIVEVKGVTSQKDLAKIDPSRISDGEFAVFAVASGKQLSVPDEGKKDGADASAQKEIRVAAAGSSQFMFDSITGRAAQNLDMFMSLANYLVQEEDFIAIKPKDVAAGTIDISSSWSQLYLMCASFVYPFLFLGGGILYWLRRRKA